VLQASVVERALVWRTTEALLTGPSTMTVSEAGSGGAGWEALEFRDRVCEVSFAHGYLVVATLTQCLDTAGGAVARARTRCDLRAPAHCILQAPRLFLLADRVNGLTVSARGGARVLGNALK